MKELSHNRGAVVLALWMGWTSVGFADESARIFRSAYFLGRGDAGIATADNHEAIFYNPAGLAQGSGIYKETILVSPSIELSKDTKDLIRKVVVEKDNDPRTLAKHEGKNQHLGLYNFTGVVFRRVALGAVASSQTNILVSKDPDAAGLSQVSASTYNNQAAVFSLAESIIDNQLFVGGTYKYWMREQAKLDVSLIEAQDVADQLDTDEIMKTGMGSGLDLGLMYRGQSKVPFSFGLTIENVGSANLASTVEGGKDIVIPQTFNLGIAFEPQTKFSRFSFMLDLRDVTGAVEENKFKRIHVGTELGIRRFVGVTAGLNGGYPTLGFYVNLYVLRFDLGGYTEEMGDRAGTRPDIRYYFRLAAGF